MPIAWSEEEGKPPLALGPDGQWTPAERAVHPKTGNVLYRDGNEWVSPPKSLLQKVDDAARAVASGATFGWADKFAAKMDELSGRGSYKENLEREQARTASVHPAVRIPGEIGGSVATTIAAAPAMAGAGAVTGLSKLPGLAKALLGGAAGGASFGAGEAKQGEELGGAATGSLLGTAAGAIGYPIASAARSLFSPKTQAAAEMSRAMQRDALAPEQMVQGAERAAIEKPGMATAADVGGENIQGLVEKIANTPGAGRSLVIPELTRRQKGQLARISGDLQELTGTSQSAFRATKDAIAERTTQAKPLYEKAYAEGERAIESPAIERLTAAPAVQRAMRTAVNQWQDSVIAQGYGAMNPGTVVENGMLKFLGGKVPVFPNLQFWDLTKQALDKMVDAQKRPDGSLTKRGVELAEITRQLRGALDEVVPDSYKAARDLWSGSKRFTDAIEEGRTIFDKSISGEELRAYLGGLPASEREGYVIGAVSTAINKMKSDPAAMPNLTKYFGSPAMREKVAAIMPTDELAQKWLQRLDQEVASADLVKRSLGNSRTAVRQAEQSDARGIVMDIAKDAMQGTSLRASLTGAVVKGTKSARDTLRSRSDKELGRMLMDDDLRALFARNTRPNVSGQPLIAGENAGLADLY